MIRAVVTDIEGTTTSIAFVKDVLFPRSRATLRAFLASRAKDPEVARLLDEARALLDDPERDDVIAALERFIDEDRKVGPLKALQGLLWEEGYRRGEIVAHVYPDVPGALRRFRAGGKRVFVYSSGSVHAQRLLFAHTEAGDLTPLFDGYFDTTTGPKGAPSSYTTIARTIGLPPPEIAFLSDAKEELDAARAAGVQTIQLAREGARIFGDHPAVTSFDAIRLDDNALIEPQ
jgi:enolase-phosphatase E1